MSGPGGQWRITRQFLDQSTDQSFLRRRELNFFQLYKKLFPWGIDSQAVFPRSEVKSHCDSTPRNATNFLLSPNWALFNFDLPSYERSANIRPFPLDIHAAPTETPGQAFAPEERNDRARIRTCFIRDYINTRRNKESRKAIPRSGRLILRAGLVFFFSPEFQHCNSTTGRKSRSCLFTGHFAIYIFTRSGFIFLFHLGG